MTKSTMANFPIRPERRLDLAVLLAEVRHARRSISYCDTGPGLRHRDVAHGQFVHVVQIECESRRFFRCQQSGSSLALARIRAARTPATPRAHHAIIREPRPAQSMRATTASLRMP